MKLKRIIVQAITSAALVAASQISIANQSASPLQGTFYQQLVQQYQSLQQHFNFSSSSNFSTSVHNSSSASSLSIASASGSYSYTSVFTSASGASAYSFASSSHAYGGFGFGPVTTLADAAQRSNRLVGAAVNRPAFLNDDTYVETLNREFNYITPENIAKWGFLQPNGPGEWDFAATDTLFATSAQNDQLIKGHALVWHIELPSFINDNLTAEQLSDLTEAHINEVLGRYMGQVYAWDVVNEAIEEDGSFRDTVFLRKLGNDYIADSFYQADAADPYARLYYNDFNIERINTKSTAVYNMLKDLVEQGVPVDGIGFQMHLVAETAPSVDEMIANFTRFTDLGLSVNVSELDVRIAGLPWDKASNFAIQRQVYHRVASACMQVPGCEGISTWGLSDRYSWIDNQFAPDDPLQFDEDFAKKPAYYGLIDGFMGLPADTVGVLPNLIANSSFETGSDGWNAVGAADITTARSFRSTGKRSLIVRQRQAATDGATIDLLGVVNANQTYDVTALASIRGKFRDNVNVSASFSCVNGDEQVQDIANTLVKFYRWVPLSGSLAVPACELEAASLTFSGPQQGVRLLVDDITVRPRGLVVDDTGLGLGDNIIANADFESGVEGWFGFGDAILDVSTVAPFSGLQSAYITNRTATFNGPAISLLDVATAGSSYLLGAQVRIEGADTADVKATVKTTCETGENFVGVAFATANENNWASLSGTVVVPDCTLSELILFFEGPEAQVNMFIDGVQLREIPVPVADPVNNIIDNSGFESGTNGWFPFGGAVLSSTSDQAFAGTRSLLATNRTATFEGPAINLLGNARAGVEYDLSAYVRIAGVAAADVRATLKATCPDGEQFIGIVNVGANDSGWVELAGSVTIPDCELTELILFIEGPEAGIDIYVDDITFSTEALAAVELVSNGDFEVDSNGWFPFGGLSIQTSSAQALSGAQSLLASNRTANFEGPAYDLLQAGAVAGGEYQLNASTRIQGVVAADVRATLKVSCGGVDQFIGITGTQAFDSSWVQLQGTINVPNCSLTEVTIYFEGPDAGIDIFLDQVSIL